MKKKTRGKIVKKVTRKELEERQKKRTKRSQSMDSLKTAKRIFDEDEWWKWIKRPGSGDIRGIDTKTKNAKKKVEKSKIKVKTTQISAENIIKRLEIPASGGRTAIGKDLIIIKGDRDYEVYHYANPRGGDFAMKRFKSAGELKQILKTNDEYLKMKKDLEGKGFVHRGKGTYVRKDKAGKTVRNKEGDIITANLYWGRKINIYD